MSEAQNALAALLHDTWSHWIHHLLEDACLRDLDGNAVLPKATKERWQRLMTTPYQELSGACKGVCRDEAQRRLCVLKSTYRLAVTDCLGGEME